MRISVQEAKNLGIWNKLPEPVRKELAKKPRNTKFNPQLVLFEAISAALPEAETERNNLIPCRKFRADIFLPSSRIVVEIDGFQEHAMYKENFHKTLDRQNLFTIHGYRTLRYYSKRITSELDVVVAEIVNYHRTVLEGRANA
jgi:very-short-patch-repair endonuclease